jgi:hypothetical protein
MKMNIFRHYWLHLDIYLPLHEMTNIKELRNMQSQSNIITVTKLSEITRENHVRVARRSFTKF